jgi:prepilin-type N-terminal cleavage/methylation domain-containing protein
MQLSSSRGSHTRQSDKSGFTLIELLVVIAIIAILAVVVVLTLNPAELLRQSRDANRVSDMATLTPALNLYTTDQSGASTFSLGNASDTYPSIYDPAASSTCGSLGLPSLNTSTGQSWYCSTSSTFRQVTSNGWIPLNFGNISAGSPIGNLPVDPVNQTSSGLFYAYNTNSSQFEVTANLESTKYHSTYGNAPQTPYFPDVISGGNSTVSALYNPTGLVGYWPMNEGTGSSTIDQSGNGNSGTWSGTPIGSNGTYYTGGIVGSYAGDFNGSNTYVNMGYPSILFPASFTISLWINPASIANSPFLIGSGNSSGWDLYILTNQGVRLLNISGGSVTGYNGITLNTWSFIVATYSGGTVTIYQNGSKAISGSLTVGTPNGAFTIGDNSTKGSSNVFNGSIDDVRLYASVLSPAEVMALYNAER